MSELTREQKFTITNDILQWIQKVIEPQEKLDGFPICPYAQRAMLEKRFFIDFCKPLQLLEDKIKESIKNWDHHFEIGFIIPETEFDGDKLKDLCQKANKGYAREQDFFLLPEHPDYDIQINGVATRLARYPMVLLQPLARLNSFAQKLQKTSYYTFWDPQTLKEIVLDRF